MAIDEFLVTKQLDYPVLRIYGWSNPCVSIGYFQSIQDVNHERCQQEGVDVLRRITGGGAVFHDKEFTYSFVTGEFPQKILDSYKEICEIIISTLKYCGFDAEFSPLNDVIVKGKKVCGNAQTRKNNKLLQHGTILLEVDKKRMFSLLNVPTEKISDKNISDIGDRVMGISKNFDEIAEIMKKSAKEIFQCELVPFSLDEEELATCKEIIKEKYSNKKWNFRR